MSHNQIRINTDPDKITILIGENGAGKSTLLNDLSKHYTQQHNNVIAIANSIHDKFNSRSKYFHFLGWRNGKRISYDTIKKSLINLSHDDLPRLNRIGQILEYVNYESAIGIKANLTNKKLEYYEKVLNNEIEDAREKEDIISLFNRLINIKSHSGDGIFWVETDSFSFDKMNRSIVTRLLVYEKKLRKIGILNSIEIYLKRDGKIIDLSTASSGELSFITSTIFISTVINEKTILLIDEPENSLHPKWQKEYITKLVDIFYLDQPKIICATHSPLLVSGVEAHNEKYEVFRLSNQGVHLINQESSNLEYLLWNIFEITTPENRFLSNLLVANLNDLANNKISKEKFLSTIEKIKDSIYDERQMSILKGVIDISKKIEDRK